MAYVLDALVYYIRNNPNASSQASRSSAEKTVTADTPNDEEGGDDVDDEDSASFKRDTDEYEDDTDHVEDEPMPTPNVPGNLHRFVIEYEISASGFLWDRVSVLLLAFYGTEFYL